MDDLVKTIERAEGVAGGAIRAGETDTDLVREYAATGSEETFRRIVQRHGPMVRALAYRQVRRSDLADDVTQAVFIALARKAEGLAARRRGAEGVSIGGWLFKATRFAATDVVRAERARRQREEAVSRVEESVGPVNGVEQAELAARLDEAVASLGRREREAVVARYYYGRSTAEIARWLGIDNAGVRKRLSRAMGHLRQRLLAAGVQATPAVVMGGLEHIGTQVGESAVDGTVWSGSAEPTSRAIRLSERIVRMESIVKKVWLGAALVCTAAGVISAAVGVANVMTRPMTGAGQGVTNTVSVDAPAVLKPLVVPAAITHAYPEFLVRDLDASVAFYCEKLGFDDPHLTSGQGWRYVILSHKGTPMVALREDTIGEVQVGSVYLQVDDARVFHDAVAGAGTANVTPVVVESWGMTEFSVTDPDGNRLRIGNVSKK